MLEDRVMLKEDQVFMVSDLHGNVDLQDALGAGLYRSDTRFLSSFSLRLNGELPILLDHSVSRGYVAIFQLVNPELVGRDGSNIPMQTLSVRRTRFLRGGVHERISVQNCGREPVQFELQLRCGADFLDIFEVRGFESLTAARRDISLETGPLGITFSCLGRDGVARRTEVIFEPVPNLEDGVATVALRLAPQDSFVLYVDVMPLMGGELTEPDFEFEQALAAVESSYRDWKASSSRIRTSNQSFDQGLLRTSQDDLRMLCNELPTGLLPTAGVPWYVAPFGRDALVTALQTLILNPSLARGTLRYLARHQGTRVDEFTEEQPGRILHEMRYGELANLRAVPHTPYFGSIDSTPLFLVLLVELLEWTGDADLLTELLPNALAALDWIDRYGDLDGDGFIEYTHPPGHVQNQNWKDSSDSLTDPDGTFPRPPIAPVEVQGYVFRAKSGLARTLRHLGMSGPARTLERQAEELAARFNTAFWLPHDRFYAQALDGAKRPTGGVSSNVGHALWSGIVAEDRAPAVVARLMAPDLATGWGIRTLSSRAISYNPMSYHNGSVWPHDNSLIAAGLSRYGFRSEAEMVARSLLEAGMRFSDQRLPELFCGFPRDLRFNSRPVEYLVSCIPQAWAAGAPFLFVQTLAGVSVDSFAGVITIDPVPTSLYRRLRVENLAVAHGELDFTVEQDARGLRVAVDRVPQGIEVRIPA